jgi:hypothetical protein
MRCASFWLRLAPLAYRSLVLPVRRPCPARPCMTCVRRTRSFPFLGRFPCAQVADDLPHQSLGRLARWDRDLVSRWRGVFQLVTRRPVVHATRVEPRWTHATERCYRWVCPALSYALGLLLAPRSMSRLRLIGPDPDDPYGRMTKTNRRSAVQTHRQTPQIRGATPDRDAPFVGRVGPGKRGRGFRPDASRLHGPCRGATRPGCPFISRRPSADPARGAGDEHRAAVHVEDLAPRHWGCQV